MSTQQPEALRLADALLSALESWSFSVGQMLPDYLLDDLAKFTSLLETEILKESKS